MSMKSSGKIAEQHEITFMMRRGRNTFKFFFSKMTSNFKNATTKVLTITLIFFIKKFKCSPPSQRATPFTYWKFICLIENHRLSKWALILLCVYIRTYSEFWLLCGARCNFQIMTQEQFSNDIFFGFHNLSGWCSLFIIITVFSACDQWTTWFPLLNHS